MGEQATAACFSPTVVIPVNTLIYTLEGIDYPLNDRPSLERR